MIEHQRQKRKKDGKSSIKNNPGSVSPSPVD